MTTISILAILLVIINCDFDPYRQRLDPKEFEEKIRLRLSQDKNLNRRKLSDGYSKYIDPTSILTFSNDYIYEVFSVRIKAEEGDVYSVYLPNMYDNTLMLWYYMEIKDENEKIIPLDTNYNNCSINEYNNIVIHTNLTENFELYVKIKMRHEVRNAMSSATKNFLYQMIWIYIPTSFRGSKCKYIFKAGSNSTIVGLQDDIFELTDNNAYIYDNDCPSSSYLIDNLRLTPYQVTWNIYNEITMSIIEDPTYAYIRVQKSYFGGSNFNFTKNELLTSIKENDVLRIGDFYDLSFRNFQEKVGYFKLNLTFSSSPIFWNVTEDNIKNTSTDETISLAKDILQNDQSSKPDYYKIGKWVKNNIKYNISYFGKDLSISDIINLKQGVCHHYSMLYNSLLNSIGIETAYANGYSVDDLDNPTDGRHGWTIAKIDGKWIGLDATWGIFSGYLPLCHLFQNYDTKYLSSYIGYGGKVEFNTKGEEVKLIEIVNFSCEMPYIDTYRKCKLCEEIDNKYPYYDFNTGECISKCSKVRYNKICYDNCDQIDNRNKYEKMENNECKIVVSADSDMYITIKNTLFLIFFILLF